MQENVLQENKMGVMPVGRLIVSMSLPIMMSMLVQALYNIVDSVFVSMINQEALNAISLAFPIQNLMIAFGTGTAVGINALVSRSLGAKDPDHANRVALNGVLLALCCYLLFLIFSFVGIPAFFSFQTTSQAVMDYGYEYLSIICGLSFGLFGQMTFERLLTSTGKTMLTMISQTTGAVFNLIFDPIFIFVFKMGVTGAALATVLGQMIACVVAITFNIRKNHELKLSFRGFKPEWKIIKSISAIGIPSIIMIAVSSVMTFIYNIILFDFTVAKTYAQNVFGIYFKLNSFVFMPIFGMNNGLIPIIAYNYGAQKRSRMLKAVKLGVIFAVVIMAVGMLVFMILPDKLLKIFITNASAEEIETILSVGVPALRIIASHFVFAAVSIVLNAVFQALGKGTYSMITSICRQLVIILPAAYVLARIGLNNGNANLVWFSFPLAEIFSLLLSILLFRRINRKLISKVADL